MSQNLEAEAQLTQERKALNEIEIMVKSLLDLKISFRPETTLSYRAIQLSRMWLGKAKGALGIKTPYAASFDSKSSVIEAKADMGNGVAFQKDANEIEAIKSMRFELNKLEGAIANDMKILLNNKKYQDCVFNAWTNCCNATMWLGEVLNQIRTEGEKPVVKLTPQPIVENPAVTATGDLISATITLAKIDEPSTAGEQTAPIEPTPPPVENVTTGSVPNQPETTEAKPLAPAAEKPASKKAKGKSKQEPKKESGE